MIIAECHLPKVVLHRHLLSVLKRPAFWPPATLEGLHSADGPYSAWAGTNTTAMTDSRGPKVDLAFLDGKTSLSVLEVSHQRRLVWVDHLNDLVSLRHLVLNCTGVLE